MGLSVIKKDTPPSLPPGPHPSGADESSSFLIKEISVPFQRRIRVALTILPLLPDVDRTAILFLLSPRKYWDACVLPPSSSPLPKMPVIATAPTLLFHRYKGRLPFLGTRDTCLSHTMKKRSHPPSLPRNIRAPFFVSFHTQKYCPHGKTGECPGYVILPLFPSLEELMKRAIRPHFRQAKDRPFLGGEFGAGLIEFSPPKG